MSNPINPAMLQGVSTLTKEDAIAKEKAQNPNCELYELTVGDDTIVVRRPGKQVYKQLYQLGTPAVAAINAADVYESCLHSCLVWPSAYEFDKMTDESPVLIGDFGVKLSRLLNKVIRVQEKKL